jgi:hypothetical protein
MPNGRSQLKKAFLGMVLLPSSTVSSRAGSERSFNA